MPKKTPTDHELRQREALSGLLNEPEWTIGEKLKDLGFNVLALIGSVVIVTVT